MLNVERYYNATVQFMAMNDMSRIVLSGHFGKFAYNSDFDYNVISTVIKLNKLTQFETLMRNHARASKN